MESASEYTCQKVTKKRNDNGDQPSQPVIEMSTEKRPAAKMSCDIRPAVIEPATIPEPPKNTGELYNLMFSSDEALAPSAKRPMLENSSHYSGKSVRMMQSMGFQAQTGLGKSGQGRLKPIEASTQNERRGLGLRLDGIDLSAATWTAHYCKHTKLRDTRHEQYKNESLALWQIHNLMRPATSTQTPDQLFKTLLGSWYEQREFIDSVDRLLIEPNLLQEKFHDPDDWLCVPADVIENTGRSVRTFIMSRGNGDVFRYTDQRTWVPLTEVLVEIPANTLLYGEVVKELSGESASQTMDHALHIIDGIVLGGKDIRNYTLSKRNELCRTFADALNKPERKTGPSNSSQRSASIRCKKMFRLADMEQFFSELEPRILRSNQVRFGLRVNDKYATNRFYVPRGVLIFKNTKPTLHKQFDPKCSDYIYTDVTNPQQLQHFRLMDLDDPNVIYSSFRSTFCYRKFWKWDFPNQVEDILDETTRVPQLVYRADFDRLLNPHLFF